MRLAVTKTKNPKVSYCDWTLGSSQHRSRTRFNLQHVNPLEKIQGVLSLSEAETGKIMMNFDLIYILILIVLLFIKKIS